MKKVSRRPNREELKKQRKLQRKLNREHRQCSPDTATTLPLNGSVRNTTCQYQTEEAERTARVECTATMLRNIRRYLPVLLKKLKKIPDPRQPGKIKHRLTMLMIYGILSFVFQMASRREANREMTRPCFKKNLQMFFPDLETLPHHDTLMRLLDRIDVDQIEEALLDLVRHLIAKKRFQQYLVQGRYPLSIDSHLKEIKYV